MNWVDLVQWAAYRRRVCELIGDENDYTATPNQVLLIVDINYGDPGKNPNTDEMLTVSAADMSPNVSVALSNVPSPHS